MSRSLRDNLKFSLERKAPERVSVTQLLPGEALVTANGNLFIKGYAQSGAYFTSDGMVGFYEDAMTYQLREGERYYGAFTLTFVKPGDTK